MTGQANRADDLCKCYKGHPHPSAHACPMSGYSEKAEVTMKLSHGNQISQNPWLKQKCLLPSPGPGPNAVIYDHVASQLVKGG